ncbi:MAG: universal stress protein [bacterium]
MRTTKLRKILFPTDFSRCANQALAHALYLSRRYHAELHMLHVTEKVVRRAPCPVFIVKRFGKSLI